ncbi:ABC transporter ATP-binding protein [Pseudonocardia acidicola]|uniref:ABC transporter ATP-binding protein n=1 Tax=Pseudonocardia acidicola TaxID=2724939 RepID=A0ABX1SHG6_9PSEU|nr:ABC transporter ATP-binding protein [Pseudonocardia acidicola]NMI01007.1 ABC transporter ATP-binding protein [Pseudonocardia acidicola]
MLLGLVLILLAQVLDTAVIWLFKILIDDVLTPPDPGLFVPVAAAYAALTVGLGLVTFADEYLAAWVAEHFLHRIRMRVFAHLQSLPLSHFERRSPGDLVNRLTGDIAAIEDLMLSGSTQALADIFKIFLFTGVLFFLNWQLSLVALVALPLFGLLARLFATRGRRAAREVRRSSGSIASATEESLGNMALVQAYGLQHEQIARFGEQSRATRRAELLATRLRAMFASLTDLLEVGGILLILGFGLLQLVRGGLTLGGLLVFLVYLSQLYTPAHSLGGLSNSIFAAAAGAERIIELLDEEPHATPTAPTASRTTRHHRDAHRPVPHRHRGTQIEFDQVRFRYPLRDTDVLTDVSFRIAPGGSMAVVGPSGSGKSTLVRLLLRFDDPTGGVVRIDGRDVRDLDPAVVRAQMAVVLQETLLFDASISDNIRAGRLDAGPDEIETAARGAGAHEFIASLPAGYATRVGPRGRQLSGGQRQRIALARALLRDAPILILDEPTTGLDDRARDGLLVLLRSVTAGRTTLLISHDPRVAALADHTVHLEHGRAASIAPSPQAVHSQEARS